MLPTGVSVFAANRWLLPAIAVLYNGLVPAQSLDSIYRGNANQRRYPTRTYCYTYKTKEHWPSPLGGPRSEFIQNVNRSRPGGRVPNFNPETAENVGTRREEEEKEEGHSLKLAAREVWVRTVRDFVFL